MTNDEFIARRRTGIGGSDVHHLFYLEPYGCARMLWFEKRGMLPPKFETNQMRRGTVLEEVAAAEFTRDTGIGLKTEPMVRSAAHPWAIVHVDRIVAGDRETIVEIKCPNRDMFQLIQKQGMPKPYILQAQHAMMVTGAKRCTFIVFCADLWQSIHFTVEPVAQLVEAIIERGEAFWPLVTDQEEPPRGLDYWAPQCRRCPMKSECHETMPEGGDPKEIEYIADLAPLAQEYDQARALEKQAKQIQDEAGNALRAALAGRNAARTDGFKITNEGIEPKFADNEKIVALIKRLAPGQDAEKLFESCKVARPSRPLRVFRVKGKR